MAKRAASETASQSAKAARMALAPTMVEEHSAALALVSSATGLPDECRAMLRVVAPLCIGMPGAERHAYQEEMAHVLSNVCGGVDSQRKEAVVAAEAHVAEAKLEAESAGVRLAEMEQQVLEIRAACESKCASATSAADRVFSAQQALSAEEARVVAFVGERACAEAEKEEYEGVLQDTFTRLTEGVKQWREREKLLKVLLEALGGLGLDRSLLDALPVALKTKAEARGVFAKLTVSAADEALRKRIALLSDQAEGLGRNLSEGAETVQHAQEALNVAQQGQSAALDAQVAAENALHEAETLMQEAAASVQALQTEINWRSTLLDESRTESVRVSELFERFVEWQDGSRASVAVVEMSEKTSTLAEASEMIVDKVHVAPAATDVLEAAEVAGA